eukprot:6178657-Pleurochrysis_carterae.AAC.2
MSSKRAVRQAVAHSLSRARRHPEKIFVKQVRLRSREWPRSRSWAAVVVAHTLLWRNDFERSERLENCSHDKLDRRSLWAAAHSRNPRWPAAYLRLSYPLAFMASHSTDT